MTATHYPAHTVRILGLVWTAAFALLALLTAVAAYGLATHPPKGDMAQSVAAAEAAVGPSRFAAAKLGVSPGE
jgi:hypothetical protein